MLIKETFLDMIYEWITDPARYLHSEDECRESILESISEIESETSIDFANWLHFNYQPCAEEGCWYDHHNDEDGFNIYKTEELYDIWIKQKSKS